MENNAGGTEGEEGAVFYDATLAGRQFYVAYKGAGVAVVVGQGIAQMTFLVAADGDGAVVEVNTGVYRLERGVDGIALLVAAYHVVAHAQRNHLFEVEHVLYHYNAAVF